MMAESTMKAPKKRIDPVRWARENLFSSWHNTILTLLVGNLAFSADPKTKNINLKCSSETYLGDP